METPVLRWGSSRLWSCVLVGVVHATPSSAVSDAEFQRLLINPDDPVLNRQFAIVAEERGDLRHALAALERALLADPNNAELMAEYERVRRKLLPTATAVTVQASINYASNPRQVPSSSSLNEDDGIADAAVSVEDERTIGGVRLRTFANASAQWDFGISELSTGRATLLSGPIIRLTQDSWLHIAPGVAISWLDGSTLYTEAMASVTAGTVFRGLTQTVTANYGWRYGGDNALGVPDNEFFEVFGRFVVSPSAAVGDYLYLQPRFRMGDPSSDQYGEVDDIQFGTVILRDVSPFDYTEWGGRVSYFVPLDNRRIFFGVGFAAYDRSYGTKVLDPDYLPVSVPTDDDRHDVYIEPTAHLIFPNLIAPNVDIRVDYRYEQNFCNDDTRDYQDHVAGLRVIGRF